MNAAEALEAAKAAFEADRPLTQQEFQGVRDFTNDPGTDLVVRGGLRELGQALDRQSASRSQRLQQDIAVAAGRERQKKLDAREQAWRALDPLSAALFSAVAETRDPALKALARHYLAAIAGNRTEAPGIFDPDGALTDNQRMFG